MIYSQWSAMIETASRLTEQRRKAKIDKLTAELNAERQDQEYRLQMSIYNAAQKTKNSPTPTIHQGKNVQPAKPKSVKCGQECLIYPTEHKTARIDRILHKMENS